MMTFLAVLATCALLGVLGMRLDSPAARAPWVMWGELRTTGVRRLLWLALVVVVGVAWLAVMAAVRMGLYGALVGVAAAACLVASLVSLDRRPVRLAVTR